MQDILAIAGVSRQALHQYKLRSSVNNSRLENIIESVIAFRQIHPKMGCRNIYWHWQDDPALLPLIEHIGRDKFEKLLISNGLSIRKPIAYHRTTRQGAYRFPNLTRNLELNDINQVWASDITYFRVGSIFFYLTVIEDLYSRKVLSVAVSQTMRAQDTVISALKQAFKNRKGVKLEGTIFHSDAGGQYIAKEFLELLNSKKLKSSMAESCLENAFVEKFHDIMKNDYLHPWKVNSFDELKKKTIRFIKVYNELRHHGSLGRKSPDQFEKELKSIRMDQREPMIIKEIS